MGRTQSEGVRYGDKIFVLKRDEIVGDWRILCIELHSAYSSTNTNRMMKSRTMR
jgi:hypothetical protein